MGLNIVRAFSLIALILVFSSTIFVIVTNIKAVNSFEAHNNSTDDAAMLDCDYIEWAPNSHSYLIVQLILLFSGSTVPNQPAGPFWAVVASLLIIVQAFMLFREFGLILFFF